ncbi:hypothetical protein DFH07DRAFT_957809 [Mycena maculata]|uniref:Uncharacterized protein n=1 Tax=Mycena maculata TaxID=230809 RepID=A0AAD7NFM1_9AGAR|nr:hypothetical protein DFH07DRAFT_957809 [Mycena maculata]
MSPKPWATEEQAALLQSMMPDFMRRQSQKKTHLFWAPMYMRYLAEFPEEPKLNLPLPTDPEARPLTDEELAKLGAAVSEKKKKLKNWFRNHRNNIGKAKGAVRAAESAIRKMFKTAKRGRLHQPIEIFQKRNPTLIRAALTSAGYDQLEASDEDSDSDEDSSDSDSDEEAGGRKKSSRKKGDSGPRTLKGRRMKMRAEVVAALWAQASPEECAAVEAMISEEKDQIAVDKGEEVKQERDGREESPQELQNGINALDAVYGDVHTTTYNASGWIGMTMLGGPNPRLGGELSMKIVCSGETPAGNNFEDVCVNFDQNVTQAFEEFLRQCFTAEARRACALPTTAPPGTVEARIAREVAPPAAPQGPKKAKKNNRQKTTSAVVAEEDNLPAGAASGVSGPADDTESESAEEEQGDNSVVGQSFVGLDPPNVEDGDEFGQHDTPSPFDWDLDGLYQVGDDLFRSPSPGKTSSKWPEGMGPPLAPEEAAVLARIERGGAGGGATMAIDPQLTALSAAGAVSPTPMSAKRAYPKPLLYPVARNRKLRGAGDAPIAMMTASSATAPYAPSALFQAFTPSRVSLPAPLTLPSSASGKARPTTGTTWAARQMSGIIGAKATPVGLAASPAPHSAPGVSQSGLSTAAGGSRLYPATGVPQWRFDAAPDTVPTIPQSRPPAVRLDLTRAVVQPQPDPVPTVPQSRPPTNGPTAKKVTTAGAAKQAKKVAVKKAAGKEGGGGADGGENGAPAPRKRGRPWKEIVEETGGEDIAPLGDATNTAPPAGPIFSISNNNCGGAQRAAAEELARKKKEEAEELERQAARGWMVTRQQWHNCLILTGARVRTAKRFADGTVAQRELKGKRINPNAALEEALLARADKSGAQGAKKRKAPAETTAPKSKRRKV